MPGLFLPPPLLYPFTMSLYKHLCRECNFVTFHRRLYHAFAILPYIQAYPLLLVLIKDIFIPGPESARFTAVHRCFLDIAKDPCQNVI